MMAKDGGNAAQYHAAAMAGAGETAMDDDNIARSYGHSEDDGFDGQRHSTNERQSRHQKQQLHDETNGIVMNGQQRVRRNSVRRQRLQVQVDGEDAPDIAGQGSVDEDYSSKSYNDSTDPKAQHQPQHEKAEVVPFLTRAQIREMSVRIKNATGDETASRAIVERLADAGVGVRITESLVGVEVYVDALTEEVKTSRDSDERERECFLYRDKQGRLFNLVIAGGAREMALSWESSNSAYSGWMACVALPFLGRLFAYFIHMGSAAGDTVTQLALLLLTIFGFVLHNEISHSWLNVSIHVLGTNSIGAHAWRSVVQADHPRYAALLLLSLAVFAPIRNSARGALLVTGTTLGFILLLANLGTRVWKKLNLDYIDGDKYRPIGSLTALFASAIVGLTFPYVGMTRVVGGSSEDAREATSSSRQIITTAATVSAIIFSLTGIGQVSSALGMPMYNRGIVNASVGLWWMMSSLVSLAACKRIQLSKYEQDEVVLERNEASPVGWVVPFMPCIGLDPANRQQGVYPKKLSKWTSWISFVAIAGLGSYLIWRGSHVGFSEEHAVWASARSSHGLIGLPTREPSAHPSMAPTVSLMPSSSPSLAPTSGPTVSFAPSASPTNSPTPAPTESPTKVPSASPTLRPSPSPSTSHSSDPSAIPSSSPTAKPTPIPSARPSSAPSFRPSSSPSGVPTSTPSVEPTPTHSDGPSLQPTTSPTSSPSDVPSMAPTNSPTPAPTEGPSKKPTDAPSERPSSSPSKPPTNSPTPQPTDGPTRHPTDGPTKRPSSIPSMRPTVTASQYPSSRPTGGPTESPTTSPSFSPTMQPSHLPSANPTDEPTTSPSHLPSTSPTVTPSYRPSTSPSDNPTERPTTSPSVSPTTPPPTQRPSPGPTLSPTLPVPTATPSARPSAGPVTVVVESKIFDMSLSLMSNYIDVGAVEHLNRALNEVTMSFLTLPNPDVTEIDFTTNLISQELAGGFLRVRVHRAAYVTVPSNGASGEYDRTLVPHQGIFDLVMLSIFTTPARKDEFLRALHGDMSTQNRGSDQFKDVSHVLFLGFYIPPTMEPSPSPSASPSEVVSDFPSSRPSQRPTISSPPTAAKINVNVQATPFGLSFTFMSKALDVAGMTALNDALNSIFPRMLQLADPATTSVEYSTLVVAQELSSPTLTIRVLRSASVSLPPLDGASGQYDESLLPTVKELDAAMEAVFASEALTKEFSESLREAVPSLFGYLIKASWEGFYYPPTPSPSSAPSSMPSMGPSLGPSEDPTAAPTFEPSQAPSQTHSAAPSPGPTTSPPTLSPTDSPSSSPSYSPVTVEIRGNSFDLSLRRMSTYMSVGSLSRFTEVLDEMVLNGLGELDSNVAVKFSSLLLSQNLGSTSLQIRVQRSTYVTVPASGGSGMYDESLLPDESAIEAVIAEILTSPTLNKFFIEKLQAAPLIPQYRYLTDVTFLGFIAAPTRRPTSTASPIIPVIEQSVGTESPTDSAVTPIPTVRISELPSSIPSMGDSSPPTKKPVGAMTKLTPAPTKQPTEKPVEAMVKFTAAPIALPTPPPSHDLTSSPVESPTTELPVATTAPVEEEPITSSAAPTGDKSLSWTISQSGQDADGGWVVSEDGMGLRFNVEASDFCHEGTNMNTQKGKAVATIEVAKETKLSYILGGQGESLDTGYEQMSLTVDRVLVASSTSRAIGVECSANPVLVTYFMESPYILTPGWHTIVVEFTTADDFDHYGTFWTVDFSLEDV